jgi:signal transduction histidine kinase
MSAVPGEGVDDKQLQRLLDAIVSVGSELDLSVMLRRIVEAAAELVDARYAALGVLDPSRTALAEFITVGLTPEEETAIGDPPAGRGILGLLIVDPHPLRLDDLTAHPDSFGWPEHHPPMTSFLGVPVPVRGEAFGNLYLCDKRSGEPFTEADEQLVAGLAAAAGVAVEHARLHEKVRELSVLADRERIARDLHDTVIQRIFATGLALQAVAARVEDPAVADRLQAAVDDLDETVRHIRTTIFELQAKRLPGRSVRQEVLGMAAETAEVLGFDPVVRFDGPIDLALPAEVADNLLATVREALANVVKHARTPHLEISLVVREGRVVLDVLDEGVGLPPELRADGQGIKNLRARAEQLGGRMDVDDRDTGGVALRWAVPLDDR